MINFLKLIETTVSSSEPIKEFGGKSDEE